MLLPFCEAPLFQFFMASIKRSLLTSSLTFFLISIRFCSKSIPFQSFQSIKLFLVDAKTRGHNIAANKKKYDDLNVNFLSSHFGQLSCWLKLEQRRNGIRKRERSGGFRKLVFFPKLYTLLATLHLPSLYYN